MSSTRGFVHVDHRLTTRRHDAGGCSRAHPHSLPPVAVRDLTPDGAVHSLRRTLRGRYNSRIRCFLLYTVGVYSLGPDHHQRRFTSVQTVVTHAPDEELLHPALTVRRHDHRGGFQHLRVVTNDLTHAPVVGIAAGHVDDELDAGFLKYRLEALGDESAARWLCPWRAAGARPPRSAARTWGPVWPWTRGRAANDVYGQTVSKSLTSSSRVQLFREKATTCGPRKPRVFRGRIGRVSRV